MMEIVKNVKIDCDDKFQSIMDDEDTLFHYTSEINGINILSSKKFNFSKQIDLSDPLENRFFKIPFSGPIDPSYPIKIKLEDYHKLINKLNSELSKYYVACFCKNSLKPTADTVKLINFSRPGYLKNRLWDYYGNVYEGICLIFSKTLIINDLEIHYKSHDIINDSVSYYYDIIDQLGFCDSTYHFVNEVEDKLAKIIFYKNIDYVDETEYRFAVKSIKDPVNIDISNSLIGIILGPKFNPSLFNDYKSLIQSLNSKRDNEIKVLEYKLDDAYPYFLIKEQDLS